MGWRNNWERVDWENTERDAKPTWFEINRNEFEELARDIYNNQDNNIFKIIINKRTYDLKNAKKIWMEVTTCKINKSETKKLYNELIQKDIDALDREKIDDIRKYNILNILNNVGSIFTGPYSHYENVLKETMLEKKYHRENKFKKRKIWWN